MDMLLGELGGDAASKGTEFLQPYDFNNFQDLFQQAYVDPAMMTYEQDIIPAIQNRFVNEGAGSSSALNQALARSAQDLTTQLGAQAGQMYQSEQDRAMQLLAALMGQSATPTQQTNQQQGIAGGLLGLLLAGMM